MSLLVSVMLVLEMVSRALFSVRISSDETQGAGRVVLLVVWLH